MSAMPSTQQRLPNERRDEAVVRSGKKPKTKDSADYEPFFAVGVSSWREFFLKSKISKDYIEPKLGETWSALLMEACGVARSTPIAEVAAKKSSVQLPSMVVRFDSSHAVLSVSLLTWCISRGYQLSSRTSLDAAWAGNMEVMRLLVQLQCPLDVGVFSPAIKQGNLEMVKFLKESGLSWNHRATWRAARAGHLDIVKYLHENGCPWDEGTCWRAAKGGHLDVLEYLHENGCPWDDKTCFWAAKKAYVHVLTWAIANGCPQMPMEPS